MRRLLWTGLICLGGAAPVSGQIPAIDQIFGAVHDVNTGVGFSTLVGSTPLRHTGLSSVTFEVTLQVAAFGCQDLAPPGDERDTAHRDRDGSLCHMQDAYDALNRTKSWQCAYDELDHGIHPDSPALADTARHPTVRECAERHVQEQFVPSQRQVQRKQGDTTITSTYTSADDAPALTENTWDVEIGLSYERLSDIRLDAPGWESEGAVDEVPMIAVYLNYDAWPFIGMYGGARAGIAKLADLQASSDPAHPWTGAGTTVAYGAAAGIDLKFQDKVFLYLEPSITRRRFPSVIWTPGVDGDPIPSALPRRLKMDTFEVAFGAQINLK